MGAQGRWETRELDVFGDSWKGIGVTARDAAFIQDMAADLETPGFGNERIGASSNHRLRLLNPQKHNKHMQVTKRKTKNGKDHNRPSNSRNFRSRDKKK